MGCWGSNASLHLSDERVAPRSTPPPLERPSTVGRSAVERGLDDPSTEAEIRATEGAAESAARRDKKQPARLRESSGFASMEADTPGPSSRHAASNCASTRLTASSGPISARSTAALATRGTVAVRTKPRRRRAPSSVGRLSRRPTRVAAWPDSRRRDHRGRRPVVLRPRTGNHQFEIGALLPFGERLEVLESLLEALGVHAASNQRISHPAQHAARQRIVERRSQACSFAFRVDFPASAS